ncbi:hypothetical protein DFJ74DRAFT_693397 [Hyaloraphidium curvatum]|nr:hypothetical protein DFJ74DRAFT_693397 [Hyaloraphidium curvatum]
MESLARFFFPSPPGLGSYHGKRILFTGCATGLGKAAVLRLASEGAAIVLVDLNEAALSATAEECRRLLPEGMEGTQIVVHVADLSEFGTGRLAVKKAAQVLGGIDFLFLNHLGGRGGTGSLSGAAFLPSMPLTDDALLGLVSCNISTSVAMVRDALPFLLESGGTICFTGSTGATLRIPFLAMYSLIKQGLIAFLESLRQELKLLPGNRHVAVTICYLNAVGTETFYSQVGRDKPVAIEAPPEQISPPAEAAFFLLESAADPLVEDAYGPLPGLRMARLVAQLFPRFIDSLTRRIPTASEAAKDKAVLDFGRLRIDVLEG